MGYFSELLSTNEEINERIRPLLRLGREHIQRAQRLDRALTSSLERDPLLSERLRRIPGVGPITALTWALEIGDYTRFRSVKEAISYCGLCSAEKSSADKVMPMPISKPRNKHIQHVLVEAAKKKNDRIDASKIADCLRCDFLPEGHMASTEIGGPAAQLTLPEPSAEARWYR